MEAKKMKRSVVRASQPEVLVDSAPVVQPAPAANPPPQVLPKPPAGWKPRKSGRKGHGPRAKAPQFANAAAAARELRSTTSYVEDFGSKAPGPETIAGPLANAAAWREHWTDAKAWCAYTSEQNGAWWASVIARIEELKPAFDYACSRDPSVAKKYPATAQILGAGKAIAARSGATRKANAKAKEKQANAHTGATASGQAPAPVPAAELSAPAVTH